MTRQSPLSGRVTERMKTGGSGLLSYPFPCTSFTYTRPAVLTHRARAFFSVSNPHRRCPSTVSNEEGMCCSQARPGQPQRPAAGNIGLTSGLNFALPVCLQDDSYSPRYNAHQMITAISTPSSKLRLSVQAQTTGSSCIWPRLASIQTWLNQRRSTGTTSHRRAVWR